MAKLSMGTIATKISIPKLKVPKIVGVGGMKVGKVKVNLHGSSVKII